jgi:hypothetical protein
MAQRARLVTILVGVCWATVALAVPGSQAQTPSLTLSLAENGVLEVTLASGVRIRTSTPTGPVLAPGTYQAIVRNEIPDFRDSQHHMFHLSGPGVNLMTDLLGGDNPTEAHTVTFQPSSTYTFADDRDPDRAHVVFSTSGAETAVSGGGAGSSSGGTVSGSGTHSNVDVVGSGNAPFRGTLLGKVSARGKLTLTYQGFRVTSLKAGRYQFTITDQTSKLGFLVQLRGQRPYIVSPVAFVGKRSLTLRLRVGKWTFFALPGKKTGFVLFP